MYKLPLVAILLGRGIASGDWLAIIVASFLAIVVVIEHVLDTRDRLQGGVSND